MPYKTGDLKGELTTPEIRKLIKAHNILVSIKIPKGSKREDIIALIKKNGYEINHEKQALIPKVEMKRKPKVDMKKADKVLPKPKTKEEKAASKKVSAEKKKEKEDKIKAEGVKQGAAIQRVIAKRKKNTTSKKEDEVRPKSKIGRPRVDPTKIKVIKPKKEDKNKTRVKQLDEKIIPTLLNEITEKYKFFDITNKASKKYRENLTEKILKKDKDAFYKDFNKFDKLVDESEDKGGDAVFRNDMIITPNGKWEKKYMLKINTINEMIGNIGTYEKELKKKLKKK